MQGLADAIQEIGRRARAETGADDVRLFRRLKWLSRTAEAAGRLALQFAPGPVGWLFGTSWVAFSLSLESQLNHSVMHGCYAGLPGADDLAPDRYDSLALPFQSRTWREAHRIHHAQPTILGEDPDTLHDYSIPWMLLTFERWAFDYDRFLKAAGLRPARDRGELRKFALFLAYQYVLFPCLAGARWKQVLAANLAAAMIRNLVFIALQTGSSVGLAVSTRHASATGRKARDEWTRFQVETSKNFVLPGIWKILCGGLDRHIEHHLFPSLPPNRFHAISGEVQALCQKHGAAYDVYPSLWASLRDAFAFLRQAP